MTAETPEPVKTPEHPDLVFRDDVTVELVRSSAQDADVLFAARVSTAGEQSLDELQKDPARSKGLINYLMRDRHGTPFEHNSMTFLVSAPIFVFREFQRHRVRSRTTRRAAATASCSRSSTSPRPSASWSSRAVPGSTSSSRARPSSTRA